MSKKTKKQATPHGLIFTVLYWVEFLGAGIIGLLLTSYFAYDIFNSLWADILYFFLISALFVTAFVQEIFSSQKTSDIIINALIFIGSLAALILTFTVGKIFILITLVYSVAMISLIAIRYALELRKGFVPNADAKQIIAALSLLFISMLSVTSIKFVDDWYMAWSLIPAAVITCVILATAYILLRNNWLTTLNTTLKRIGYSVLIIFCVFIIAYICSFLGVAIINRLFDGDPSPSEYVVLEKHVQSGARRVTSFEIKVDIDGKEKWIETSVTEYHSISEGDTVIINYYKGALGFAYYVYEAKI